MRRTGRSGARSAAAIGGSRGVLLAVLAPASASPAGGRCAVRATRCRTLRAHPARRRGDRGLLEPHDHVRGRPLAGPGRRREGDLHRGARERSDPVRPAPPTGQYLGLFQHSAEAWPDRYDEWTQPYWELKREPAQRPHEQHRHHPHGERRRLGSLGGYRLLRPARVDRRGGTRLALMVDDRQSPLRDPKKSPSTRPPSRSASRIFGARRRRPRPPAVATPPRSSTTAASSRPANAWTSSWTRARSWRPTRSPCIAPTTSAWTRSGHPATASSRGSARSTDARCSWRRRTSRCSAGPWARSWRRRSAR